jgi:hypothetical protein
MFPALGIAEQVITGVGLRSPGTKAEQVGMAIGEILGGAALVWFGGGGTIAGVGISATGIGAVLGVPAVAVSAGLVTAGVANMAAGIYGLGKALTTGGSTVGPPAVTSSAKVHKHHVFPQRFKDWFKLKGIDIDQYTVRLPQADHLKGVHGKGNGVSPGDWNPRWKQFIDDNKGADRETIFKFMEQLRKDFGIDHLPFEPY